MVFKFKSKKSEFLINELMQITLLAGLQTRNKSYPIYKKSSAIDDDRTNIKESIKFYLLTYLDDLYTKAVSENTHVEKINELSNFITEKYSEILFNGRFRIGVSQKIINLFLKYMWVIGEINEPYHCPFDSIIKGFLEKDNKVKTLIDWTSLDNIEDYLKYVEKARVISLNQSLSIAEWELQTWKNLFSNVA